MTPDQKGGVAKPPQTDIKNEVDLNRSISDQDFCGVLTDEGDDVEVIGDMLQPELFHTICGKAGAGKTHLCVNLMYLLHTGFQGCGDWEIITNIFMYRKDATGIKVCTPGHVHHVDSIDELFLKITELYGHGRKVAIVLDDIYNFYSTDGKGIIRDQIRQLVVNRNKLRLLLILSSRDSYIEFENDIRRDFPCDCDWGRFECKSTWENARKDYNFNPKWKRLDANEVCMPSGEWIHVFLSVTDWTDHNKKEGWFFDSCTQSSILRYDKAFDFSAFWKGFGNISSLEVTDYIHRYHEEHPKVFETEKSQMVKNYADIVAKLKSMGLTDEAIEYALKTPKTTLRRWAEKQGYEWRKWSMNHSYRFKKIYGEKQDASQAE